MAANIEAVITAGRAPSIAVAVARDGRLVWSDAFGQLTDTGFDKSTLTRP